MPLITVRVDEQMKRQMADISINWSEAIRLAIASIIEEQARRNRVRAAQVADKIRIPAPKGWDSTEVIRAWRDARHGPGRRR